MTNQDRIRARIARSKASREAKRLARAEQYGRIVRRMHRAGIVRMRRKMKRLHRMIHRGKVRLDDVFLAVKSWLGNAEKYADSYRTRKRVLNQYHKLFHSYRMEGVIA